MFCIQDPSYENSKYLHETLISECVGCTTGAGAYAFATKDGINLLLLDDNFKDFLETGTFTLVVGTDDITNEHSIVSLIELQKKYGSHLVVKAYVHKGKGSTFHPKFSWFQKTDGGALVLGSGNLTQKGLRHNREAYNVVQYDEFGITEVIDEWNRWFVHSAPFLFDITDPVVLAKAKQNSEKIKAVSTAKATVQKKYAIKPGEIKLSDIYKTQPKDKKQGQKRQRKKQRLLLMTSLRQHRLQLQTKKLILMLPIGQLTKTVRYLLLKFLKVETDGNRPTLIKVLSNIILELLVVKMANIEFFLRM